MFNICDRDQRKHKLDKASHIAIKRVLVYSLKYGLERKLLQERPGILVIDGAA